MHILRKLLTQVTGKSIRNHKFQIIIQSIHNKSVKAIEQSN